MENQILRTIQFFFNILMFWYFVLVFSILWQLGVGFWAVNYMKKQLNTRLKYLFQDRELEDRFKPFHRTDFKSWDQKEILRNLFLIFPLKLLIVLHVVFTGVTLVYICVFFDNLFKRRFGPTRRIFQVFCNYYCRVLLLSVCNTTQIHHNARPSIPEPIVISNHVCWFEIFYIVTVHHPISFLAKSEVEKIPCIGTIAKFNDSLFVDRGDEDKKDDTLIKIRERCDAVEKGERSSLLIFPEGTISNNQQIITFKKGAFDPLARIKIVGLKYHSKYNMGMDNMGQLCHMLLFFSTYPKLEMHVIHDVRPRSQDPKDYADQCRQILSKTLNIPMSEARFRDYLDLTKMLRSGYEEITNRKSK